METIQPPAKRKRLSHACTRCRTKKVRCDELLPGCTNCVRANVACVTFDPRTLAMVQRREAQSQPPAASPSVPTNAYSHRLAGRDIEENGSPRQPEPAATTEAESPAVSYPYLPVLPRFLNGNSLSVLTQWLDLAFARLGMSQRLHQTYNKVRYNEKRQVYTNYADHNDVPRSLPSLPQAVSTFTDSLGWIAPILIATPLDDPASVETHLGTAADEPRPLRALVHAVQLVMGDTDKMHLAESCFGYAYRRLPSILEASGALGSIRALLLMSIYLHWREDVERAWQMLSLAVASLQNNSLHREHKAAVPGSQYLFWSVFVLDKVLSSQLERRPMLSGADCNIAPPLPSDGRHGAVFRAAVDFSKLQDEILEKLQLSRRAEEEAYDNHTPIHQVIKAKLRLVGELDQKLIRFADNLPQELKPTEYLFAGADSLSGVTFLAVQYYQAVFLVSRNALFINMQAVHPEIDKAFEGKPCTNRLKNGMNICVNAARAMLNILNHAAEMGVRCPFSTPYAPLMAMYALTIHIVRRQSPATARVDLELQVTAMSLIKRFYSFQQGSDKDGSSRGSGLLQMLERLHRFSESFVSRAVQTQPAPTSAPTSADGNPNANNTEQWRPAETSNRVISPPQSPTNQVSRTNGGTGDGAGPSDIGDAFAAAQDDGTVPLSDFNEDWFLDMNNWDELAMALGLPAEGG